jgi:hypothetical protein
MVIHWLILREEYYITQIKRQTSHSYNGWKGRKLKETCQLNEIILNEEINQPHRNGIPVMLTKCTYLSSLPFEITSSIGYAQVNSF